SASPIWCRKRLISRFRSCTSWRSGCAPATPETNALHPLTNRSRIMAAKDEPQYLYLTTTGRKSGRPHQIEIWFVEHGGCYYLIPEGEKRGDWELNIFHDPKVIFSVGTRDEPPTDGTGRAVDPAAEPELAAAVRALMDTKYAWSDGSIVELKP